MSLCLSELCDRHISRRLSVSVVCLVCPVCGPRQTRAPSIINTESHDWILMVTDGLNTDPDQLITGCHLWPCPMPPHPARPGSPGPPAASSGMLLVTRGRPRSKDRSSHLYQIHVHSLKRSRNNTIQWQPVSLKYFLLSESGPETRLLLNLRPVMVSLVPAPVTDRVHSTSCHNLKSLEMGSILTSHTEGDSC